MLREETDFKKQKEHLLDACREHREMLGNRCEIIDTEDSGKVLEILLPQKGNLKIDVGFEISFIGGGENSNVPYFAPQIGGNIFKNIPKENHDEVLKTCNYVNGSLVSGFFGLLDDSLYYKSNLIIRAYYPDEVQIQLLADALLVGENAVNAVIDSFAFIGRGLSTLEKEVAEGRLI